QLHAARSHTAPPRGQSCRSLGNPVDVGGHARRRTRGFLSRRRRKDCQRVAFSSRRQAGSVGQRRQGLRSEEAVNLIAVRTDPLSFLGEELDALKAQGLYRRLRVLGSEQAARAVVDGRPVVNLSSNNYLELTTHPRLKEKALEALERFGVGTGSVRTIAGTMDLHMELERRLADFKKTEAVVVFQSGFAANAGTVAAILTKDDVVVSDELNHASIIDGCRLSRASIKVFPHRDVTAARAILRDLPKAQKKILITDGVFSMDGDLGRVPELSALAEEFGAIMMVDDAHASGVFGRNGSGTVDHFGCHGRVDIQVGTLSKAVGALGGYVAGSRALIDFLYHRARPFLFSTSHPPAVAAACLAAIDVLQEEPQLIDRLWENTRFFKAGLHD